jgi:hypothetical protein
MKPGANVIINGYFRGKKLKKIMALSASLKNAENFNHSGEI